MARIDDFRAQLQYGGARASHFEVQINFPSGLTINSAGVALFQQKFFIKAASLPGSMIQGTEVPFRGRLLKVAGERVFSNWNIQVINDNDMSLRNAFEEWSAGILKHASTGGVLAPADYQADAYVHQLDRNDNVIKTYKFHGIFPQNIGEIGLDFGNSNSIEEFSVELSVDYWTTEDAVLSRKTTESV